MAPTQREYLSTRPSLVTLWRVHMEWICELYVYSQFDHKDKQGVTFFYYVKFWILPYNSAESGIPTTQFPHPTDFQTRSILYLNFALLFSSLPIAVCALIRLWDFLILSQSGLLVAPTIEAGGSVVWICSQARLGPTPWPCTVMPGEVCFPDTNSIFSMHLFPVPGILIQAKLSVPMFWV